MTTTTVLHAAARGIEIESLTTRLAGDLDVQGLLGLGSVPAHSPVCNTVCRPVPVVVERVKR